MSTPSSTKLNKAIPGYTFVQTVAGIDEYILKSNGLHVLFLERPETGVITTNITYRVGARDEAIGETGVAHMLEHMLFKPTRFDISRKSESAAMTFEREVGCVLNANTWKDRTTYYFSYPKEHFARALQIEAERMTGVVLTEAELKPERQNVLSEFDMYNGNPDFALGVQMTASAFNSHPYQHETIGFREDIEDYTAEALERFYVEHYRPDNAILMVIGDIDKKTAFTSIKKLFGDIPNPALPLKRAYAREPKQEGTRRVTVTRPSTTNLIHIGFKHAGFPSKDWFIATLVSEVLANGPESILHKLLVDTGKAASVSSSLEPCSHTGLGTVAITLAEGENHAEIESLVLRTIDSLTVPTLTPLVKKAKAGMITDELFARDHSLKIAAALTEYVASENWEVYGKTLAMLESITPKMVLECSQQLFKRNQLTIGYFIGTHA